MRKRKTTIVCFSAGHGVEGHRLTGDWPPDTGVFTHEGHQVRTSRNTYLLQTDGQIVR